MSKGYTNALLVAQEVGRALSADEMAQADLLAAAAEDVVDRSTGRSWLGATPVVGELHTLFGPFVYLDHPPVASVASVAVRAAAVGAVATTLAAGSGYELLDPAAGLLLIGAYPLGDVVINTTSLAADHIATITYTPVGVTPPEAVKRATTVLVARWLRDRVEPTMVNAKSISVGQGDLAITYRDAAAGQRASALPADVEALLRPLRRVAFA